jgi:very-short-patch-repair endonuclease
MVGGRVLAVVDVLFAAQRLVIEVDGWRTHGTRAAFQRDRATQNALVGAGYLVLRFTWTDLTQRPEHVVRTIRDALARTERSTATH